MKSNLITRTGHDKLVAELQRLWHEERPEITRKVNWAASLGDRSENADYKYNKQILRQIDRRVRYLGKRLEELKLLIFHLNKPVKYILVLGSRLRMTKVKKLRCVLLG